MVVSGIAPLASPGGALVSLFGGYVVSAIIAGGVAICGGIARFIYILKHRDNPGVGFTQRRRYQNEVRRRQELAQQAAELASTAVGEAEPPGVQIAP